MKREEQIRLARQLLESGVLSEESANEIKADFPELAESEDERIRKAIESIIRVYGKIQGEWIAGYDVDTLVVHLRDAFAYLEKQKEQPVEWSEEQPEVDLKEEEIEKWWQNWASPPRNEYAVFNKEEFINLARHFYELGLNARKEE